MTDRHAPAIQKRVCPACHGRDNDTNDATGLCRCRDCGHLWPARVTGTDGADETPM